MGDTKQVPLEPTEEMGRVSGMRFKCHCGRAITQWAVNKWADMLAAAPPEDELARLEYRVATTAVLDWFASDDNRWFDVHPKGDDWDMAQYGLKRGLLERHPDNPNLVRIKGGEG